jgi:hypothetical protein
MSPEQTLGNESSRLLGVFHSCICCLGIFLSFLNLLESFFVHGLRFLSASEPENEMESGFVLDFVVCQGKIIFELPTSKN